MPSRYALNLIKMNNTNLTCVAATAGTSIGQDMWIDICHYQLSIQNFIRKEIHINIYAHDDYIPTNSWFSR